MGRIGEMIATIEGLDSDYHGPSSGNRDKLGSDYHGPSSFTRHEMLSELAELFDFPAVKFEPLFGFDALDDARRFGARVDGFGDARRFGARVDGIGNVSSYWHPSLRDHSIAQRPASSSIPNVASRVALPPDFWKAAEARVRGLLAAADKLISERDRAFAVAEGKTKVFVDRTHEFDRKVTVARGRGLGRVAPSSPHLGQTVARPPTVARPVTTALPEALAQERRDHAAQALMWAKVSSSAALVRDTTQAQKKVLLAMLDAIRGRNLPQYETLLHAYEQLQKHSTTFKELRQQQRLGWAYRRCTVKERRFQAMAQRFETGAKRLLARPLPQGASAQTVRQKRFAKAQQMQAKAKTLSSKAQACAATRQKILAGPQGPGAVARAAEFWGFTPPSAMQASRAGVMSSRNGVVAEPPGRSNPFMLRAQASLTQPLPQRPTGPGLRPLGATGISVSDSAPEFATRQGVTIAGLDGIWDSIVNGTKDIVGGLVNQGVQSVRNTAGQVFQSTVGAVMGKLGGAVAGAAASAQVKGFQPATKEKPTEGFLSTSAGFIKGTASSLLSNKPLLFGGAAAILVGGWYLTRSKAA